MIRLTNLTYALVLFLGTKHFGCTITPRPRRLSLVLFVLSNQVNFHCSRYLIHLPLPPPLPHCIVSRKNYPSLTRSNTSTMNSFLDFTLLGAPRDFLPVRPVTLDHVCSSSFRHTHLSPTTGSVLVHPETQNQPYFPLVFTP